MSRKVIAKEHCWTTLRAVPSQQSHPEEESVYTFVRTGYVDG
jgi:hypothetical protein